MASQAFTPTPDDLRALGDHVLYEAEMTSRLIAPLSGQQFARLEGGGDQLIENALVEAFVMHVRALLEFLFNDKPKRDDGSAVHMVRDVAEWTRRRGRMSPFLREVRRRSNKGIAHVTFSRKRLTEEAHEWGVGNVHEAVSRVLVEFIPLVPEERVLPAWHERMWKTIPGFVRGRENFDRPPRISVPTQGLGPPTG